MLKYLILWLFLFIACCSSFCKANDPRGEFLLKGHSASLKHNYQEAFKWYKKSAELGDAGAMFSLGTAYSHGEGVPRNHQEALKWYKKSAELGDVSAMFMLGNMYHEGKLPLKKDDHEAFKWYKKGVNPSDFDAILPFFDELGRVKGIKGSIDARVKRNNLFIPILHLKWLGDKYYKGEGTHQDYREAFRCWKKAVQLSDPGPWAMCRLGIAYYKGEGVLKDPKQAKYWVEKAYDADVSEDAYDACLEYGRPKDAWNKLELWKY